METRSVFFCPKCAKTLVLVLSLQCKQKQTIMATLLYQGYYISHNRDYHHEICKVYTDAEQTNLLCDFVLLDVHGGCFKPVSEERLETLIKNKFEQWLEKTDNKIKTIF